MRNARKGVCRLVLGLVAGALALAGFSGSGYAAKDQIVIDLVNEPSTLDPHMQWNPDSYNVYRNIFDNVVTRDNAGTIVPQIAESWKYLSDSELELTIRGDVAFHNGDKLGPDDVVYSVERITDKEFGSPQLGQFNNIIKAEKTGDHTVKLTTKGPYPALLAQLVKLSVVPKAYVEKVGREQFNLQPIGSGPYKFKEWNRGVQVILERNDAYWGKKGEFATATFRAVPDASTRVANLRAGTSDLVVTLDPDLAEQIKTAPGIEPRSVLTERVGFLRVNPARIKDVRLRQAIVHAIDKQLIVEGLLGNFDKPVDIMLSPAHFGWVDGIKGLGFDPEKAKALIAEIGEPAKRKLEFATSPVYDQRIVQALQQMFTDVGLNVEIVMTDMSTYLSKVRAKPEDAPELSFGRWSCACQDADGVLFPLLHSSSNWSYIRDPKFDAPLEKARQTLDKDERLAAYKQVHERLISEIPLAPLYQAAIIYGVKKQLQWTPTPNESMFLNRMSWKD